MLLTDQCNLSCKHCFLGDQREKGRRLSWGQIKTALGYFRQDNFGSVEFTGGEPSLSPFLKKAVKYAREIGYSQIGIDTNGARSEVVDWFSPEEVSKFTFSLDGASPETHDFLRGEGHFQQVLGTIKKAVFRGFQVYVVFCVNKRNVAEVRKVIPFLDELGVSRLSFNFISFMGSARNYPQILISPEEWIDLRRSLKKIKGLKNLTLRFPTRFANRREYDRALQEGYQCLLKNPQQAHVMPNGYVFYCWLLDESPELASGFVDLKEVVFRKNGERKVLKDNPRSPCPAQELLIRRDGIPHLASGIVPLCICWKEIVSPEK